MPRSPPIRPAGSATSMRRRSRPLPRSRTCRRPTKGPSFAYNRCLEAVKDSLDERRARPDAEVPWSGYSLINWWNAWKRSKDAGCLFAVDLSGRAELVEAGLSWRTAVCAQVFEEAAVDLGRALGAFSASKRGTRRGHHGIRVGEQGARSLTLPVIGPVAIREDTRRLRRMLRPGSDGVSRARSVRPRCPSGGAASSSPSPASLPNCTKECAIGATKGLRDPLSASTRGSRTSSSWPARIGPSGVASTTPDPGKKQEPVAAPAA